MKLPPPERRVFWGRLHKAGRKHVCTAAESPKLQRDRTWSSAGMTLPPAVLEMLFPWCASSRQRVPQGKVLGPVISKLGQKSFTCTCKKHIFWDLFLCHLRTAKSKLFWSCWGKSHRNCAAVPFHEWLRADSSLQHNSDLTVTSECYSGSWGAVTPSCSRAKHLHPQTGEADIYRNRNLLLGYSNLMVDSEHPIIKTEQWILSQATQLNPL